MIRSCITSTWKILSLPAPNRVFTPVKTLNITPSVLKPACQWISYFLRPALIQPSVNEFLKPNSNHEIDEKRTLTKFSLRKGKRKSVKAVLKRFYRLDWGMWIRTKCGRHKKLYKKSANRKRRLRQHVFTNATQSWLLDKMVTSYWRKPKYYVDDEYEPYHRREEFPITRKRPYIPPVK